jgi:hypothetical protein
MLQYSLKSSQYTLPLSEVRRKCKTAELFLHKFIRQEYQTLSTYEPRGTLWC